MAQFSSAFDDDAFLAAIATSNGDLIPRRLSLHFTAPDIYQPCLCSECGPAPAVEPGRASAYLNRVVRQLALVGTLFDRDRDVVQVSLDPGVTTLFGPDEISEIFDSASRHFHVLAAGKRDVAVTLDHSHGDPGVLAAYAALGVNRAGFALQAVRSDNDPMVDPVIRVEACRAAGICNVRIDLVYGAPRQDLEAVLAQLSSAVRARPDRVALRDCAHLPDSFRQPAATGQVMPDPLARASTLLACDRYLRDAGYLHLGMDLYVLQDDPLYLAKAKGQLYRDALGFGAHGETDLVGFGVGAISQVGATYAQSATHLRRWEAAIDVGRRAIQRGAVLDEDDLARSEIIQALLCDGFLLLNPFEDRHFLDFPVYFADALARLTPLADAGLLEIGPDAIRLTSSGALVSRIVAACFDRYLHAPSAALAYTAPRSA
jgi:oxygen-independent coproporphyrinogen-3 oxidase